MRLGYKGITIEGCEDGWLVTVSEKSEVGQDSKLQLPLYFVAETPEKLVELVKIHKDRI